jgi:perosamine synthetase
MITTNDEELANKIRRFNSLGYAGVAAGAGKGKISKDDIQDPNYQRHISIGWNYRMSELCAAVALGQLERLEELVAIRKKNAEIFASAIEGHDWLKPQMVPQDISHSFWSYVVKLDNDHNFSWYDFRKKYMELGGDGIYAAWLLTYLEPALKNRKFSSYQVQNFETGLCPVAESIQPKFGFSSGTKCS